MMCPQAQLLQSADVRTKSSGQFEGKLEKEREERKVKLGDCGLRCKFKV